MYVNEFKDLLAKLRPVIGDMADAFWLATLLDPQQQRDVYAVTKALAAELLDESYTSKHILLEPPPAEKSNGQYPLGKVIYAGKPMGLFGLMESDLPPHISVLGRSGAGKTNVGHLIIWNLLKAKKPFIIFDWRKSYRHFRNRPEGKDVLVFAPGKDKTLSFNPIIPPPKPDSAQSQAYLRDIVSVIVNTYLPGQHLLSTRGVEYLFLRTLKHLEEENIKPITFNDMKHYIERYKATSREADWKASARNVLFKLTTGPIGQLMNSSSDMTIADILDKSVILELDSLGSPADRSLFTQTFLLWLYYQRLAEGKSASSKHVVIVEEAHNVFLKKSSNEQSVHDFVLRQFRDLGQAVVLLDQNPSLLSIPALGNTGTTICLNLKHADDIEAAGKAMTLPRKDWEHIGRLPVGHAIVKLPSRWLKPFLVRFPEFPLNHSASNVDVRSNLLSVSLQEKLQELRSALNEAIRALPETDREETIHDEIATQEHNMLLDIARHPLSVVTERYKRLGLTAHSGNRTKQKLLNRNMIAQEKVGVPNGSVTLMKLTNEGRRLLNSSGVQIEHLPRNAGLEHEYYKQLITSHYREMGYTVKNEVPLAGGKAVDLVATKGNNRIAIEVETGKSDIIENIRKCEAGDFSQIIIVAKSQEVALRIMNSVSGRHQSNIFVLTVSDILLSA